MPQKATVTDKLTLEVVRQFRVVYGAMRHHFRLLEASCGISGSQAWALQEIAHRPGVGISELAACLGVHQSTCSLLVDKLAGRELLEKRRTVADQRRVGLHISAAGRLLLQRLPGPPEGLLPDALGKLPRQTLQALRDSMNALVRQLPAGNEAFSSTPLAEMLQESEEVNEP